MSRTNLISASLSAEQKTAVLKCLNEAQQNLPFLINISSVDKRRLTKMGTKAVGYVDDCVATFEEFKSLLPGNLNLDELRRDRALFEELSAIAVKVRALNESLQDSIAALSSDMMTTCNDGYSVLKRSGLRDNAVKQAAQQMSRHHKGKGPRAARAQA